MRKSPSAFCAGYLDAGQLCSGTGFLELGARVYYNHHPCNTARPAALARLSQPQQAGRKEEERRSPAEATQPPGCKGQASSKLLEPDLDHCAKYNSGCPR